MNFHFCWLDEFFATIFTRKGFFTVVNCFVSFLFFKFWIPFYYSDNTTVQLNLLRLYHIQSNYLFFNKLVSLLFLFVLFVWISFHITYKERVFHQYKFFLRLICPDCLNFLSHYLQAKGFSSVWIIFWFFIILDLLNFLSQYSHVKGFSPVWIL